MPESRRDYFAAHAPPAPEWFEHEEHAPAPNSEDWQARKEQIDEKLTQ